MQIHKDCVVTIEYTLRNDEGVIIDSSDNHAPLSFIQGSGAVFPALEQALEAQHSGARLEVKLTPEQGYGDRDERLVKEVPREKFKSNDALHPGMHYKTVRDGEEIDVIIIGVNDKSVTIDANPPLAGVPLTIDLVIIEVRHASPQELQSGVVQEMDDIYGQATMNAN